MWGLYKVSHNSNPISSIRSQMVFLRITNGHVITKLFVFSMDYIFLIKEEEIISLPISTY